MSTRNKSANVRIVDIAEAAGVSVTTVSRALNHKEGDIRISEQTIQRIHKIAEELGYQRNLFATALRTNRTGLVGAINAAVRGTYMSKLAYDVQISAQAKGLELFIGIPQAGDDAIKGQLTVLQNQLFDGILFLGFLPDYQLFMKGSLDKPHVHVIPGIEENLPIVSVDETAGVELALSYLASLGHRRIACLGSSLWPWDKQRIQVYQAFVTRHGYCDHVKYLADLDTLPYSSHDMGESSKMIGRHVADLMAQRERPTAIFCTNDGFGAAVVKALYRLNLRVPHDVSVVGYGNHHDAIITYPELTTVRIPNRPIAESACKLLMQLMDKPQDADLKKSKILLKPELIVRESTRRIV